jgi:hypothetical protein
VASGEGAVQPHRPFPHSSAWKKRSRKPTKTREVDRNAIKEILGDLETRLEAYLVEWRREVGLRGASEGGIDRIERIQVETGREKEVVEPPGPTR